MSLSDNIVSEVRESRLKKNLGFFEGNLIWWAVLSIVAGLTVGYFAEDRVATFAEGNFQSLNILVVVLVWLMIFPRMVQIDFSSIKKAGDMPGGISLAVVISWLVKPLFMAVFAWLFFENVFAAFFSSSQAQQYVAGAIVLGAAPCTAMVFVWTYLTNGNPIYSLAQVSVNDFILLIIYVPVAGFLLGISGVSIYFPKLLTAVLLFIALPLTAGFLANLVLRKLKGEVWFREVFLKKLKAVSVIALLATVFVLFVFQGRSIIDQPLHLLFIAIPIVLLAYTMFFLTWICGKALDLPHSIRAPGAMIGASNFFEFSVAVSIVLFGLNSGAALVAVTGMLIEVPLMLSLVRIANKLSRGE
ncbi:ACR3 family arsenite efflux transporter [Cytophagaceae bacterium ABcell3]|nr:ACR3 family arsenite efflux transporter [Cytophagaceae bacterium ABcell3]